MDTGRLTQGQLIAAGSAALLLLSLFLPWTGLDLPAGTPEGTVGESSSGWESNNTLDIYLFIVVLFALVPALMRLTGGDEELPFLDNAATFLLGAIGTILTLYVLINPGIGDIADAAGVDFERKIGLFLATLAVIGVTVGAYMAMQEEGAAPVDEYR